ncbi:MAG: aldolase [Myxococcales bacterium]|nr:aldolase [Myxococcales bacterium]
MDTTIPEIRRNIVDLCRDLHRRNWVANHDGNISVRLPGNKILITPTAMSKGDVREIDLVEIGLNGKRLSGSRRPPSEMRLHLIIYKNRPDVQSVVHAHPPASVAHAVTGMEIPTTMMAEPIVSIGDRIPLVPFAPPGSADLHQSLADTIMTANCLLLEQHGPIAAGDDLEQARLRFELIEHLANIHLKALQLGSIGRIPEPVMRDLLKKHHAAGLGAPGLGIKDT